MCVSGSLSYIYILPNTSHQPNPKPHPQIQPPPQSTNKQILASLDIPFAVRCVMFARQAPQTGVQPHSDARNFILTAHLGLKVPTDPPGACWMRVAEETRGWEEGKVVVIDTTFEHETGVSFGLERGGWWVVDGLIFGWLKGQSNRATSSF